MRFLPSRQPPRDLLITESCPPLILVVVAAPLIAAPALRSRRRRHVAWLALASANFSARCGEKGNLPGLHPTMNR